MSTPSPAPQPQPQSGVPTVNFTIPDTGSTPGYGLTSDAAAAQFDLAGMTGLGSGVVSGTDLLKAFIAAGSGRGDPSIVAAIQQALYLSGGYYSDTFVPKAGSLRKDDIEAFATALNQLASTNEANPQGAGMPTMTVAQFLTQSAQSGLEGGQLSATATAAKTAKAAQYTITRPDPKKLADTYIKVAESVEGGKPSPDEVQAFVNYEMSRQIGTQKKNARVAFDAANGIVPDQTKLPMSTPAPNLPHGLTATDPNTGTSPEAGSFQTADFPDAMNTLQQIIATNAVPGAHPDKNTVTTPGAPGLTGVLQQDQPDPTVDAEDFARNRNPQAVAQNDMGNALMDFLNLISTKLV